MPKKQIKLKKRPGPEPEVLKIEGNWKDAMRKLVSKKRPVGGWPKPEKKQTVVKPGRTRKGLIRDVLS